ncbi:MAG: hypothetical protein QOD84_1359 [Acidobacteriaceae bacterium]
MIFEETIGSPLAHWESFYVIVGSSAGALTGLQFVVMALIADGPSPASMQAVRAFGTPTVVHFCAALLISAVLSAPWDNLRYAGFVLGAFGVAGLAYALNVIRHARRQSGYAPDAEDWLWYTALPIFAYVALVSGAVLLLRGPGISLDVVAVSSLLLLFVGIHNSWDSVTYVAINQSRDTEKNKKEK